MSSVAKNCLFFEPKASTNEMLSDVFRGRP